MVFVDWSTYKPLPRATFDYGAVEDSYGTGEGNNACLFHGVYSGDFCGWCDFQAAKNRGEFINTKGYGKAVKRPESNPDYLLQAIKECQVKLCPWLSRTADKVVGRDLNELLNLAKKIELALEHGKAVGE